VIVPVFLSSMNLHYPMGKEAAIEGARLDVLTCRATQEGSCCWIEKIPRRCEFAGLNGVLVVGSGNNQTPVDRYEYTVMRNINVTMANDISYCRKVSVGLIPPYAVSAMLCAQYSILP
jgi:hypothetical protein